MGANCACEGKEPLVQSEVFEDHIAHLVPDERHSTYVPHKTTQAASRDPSFRRLEAGTPAKGQPGQPSGPPEEQHPEGAKAVQVCVTGARAVDVDKSPAGCCSALSVCSDGGEWLPVVEGQVEIFDQSSPVVGGEEEPSEPAPAAGGACSGGSILPARADSEHVPPTTPLGDAVPLVVEESEDELLHCEAQVDGVHGNSRPVVPPLKLPPSRYPPVPPLKLPAAPYAPYARNDRHRNTSTKLPRLLQSQYSQNSGLKQGKR